MTDDLEACHAKLRRAYKHLGSLDRSIKNWGEGNPYPLSTHFDEQTGEHVILITEKVKPPVLEWGVITGDVLHNLRSTLDHLICVIAKIDHPDYGCAGTAFPVLEHESNWKKHGLSRLGPIASPSTVDMIRGLQPFVRWRSEGNREPLLILNW